MSLAGTSFGNVLKSFKIINPALKLLNLLEPDDRNSLSLVSVTINHRHLRI